MKIAFTFLMGLTSLGASASGMSSGKEEDEKRIDLAVSRAFNN